MNLLNTIAPEKWLDIGTTITLTIFVAGIGAYVHVRIMLSKHSELIERNKDDIKLMITINQYEVELKLLREDIKNLRSAQNIDKMQIEQTFTKLEEKIEKATAALIEVKTILKERSENHNLHIKTQNS